MLQSRLPRKLNFGSLQFQSPPLRLWSVSRCPRYPMLVQRSRLTSDRWAFEQECVFLPNHALWGNGCTRGFTHSRTDIARLDACREPERKRALLRRCELHFARLREIQRRSDARTQVQQMELAAQDGNDAPGYARAPATLAAGARYVLSAVRTGFRSVSSPNVTRCELTPTRGQGRPSLYYRNVATTSTTRTALLLS
jgi:hypothetical protein